MHAGYLVLQSTSEEGIGWNGIRRCTGEITDQQLLQLSTFPRSKFLGAAVSSLRSCIRYPYWGAVYYCCPYCTVSSFHSVFCIFTIHETQKTTAEGDSG